MYHTQLILLLCGIEFSYFIKCDVYSKLLQDRILLLGSEVNDDVANTMVSQLLYLASADPHKDITLYINSPGGSVQAGLAIFDALQYIPCEVNTICFGMAASMGAFLLAAGTKGKRKSLPNSRIMIHQPLGGSQGEVTFCSKMKLSSVHQTIVPLSIPQFNFTSSGYGLGNNSKIDASY